VEPFAEASEAGTNFRGETSAAAAGRPAGAGAASLGGAAAAATEEAGAAGGGGGDLVEEGALAAAPRRAAPAAAEWAAGEDAETVTGEDAGIAASEDAEVADIVRRLVDAAMAPHVAVPDVADADRRGAATSAPEQRRSLVGAQLGELQLQRLREIEEAQLIQASPRRQGRCQQGP
jgi:hypothetical protein